MVESMDHRESDFYNVLITRARQDPKTLLFSECTDIRTYRAVGACVSLGIAMPVLYGDPAVIKTMADTFSTSLDGVRIIDSSGNEYLEQLAHSYGMKRGIPIDQALKVVTRPHFFGGMMIAEKKADCMIGGVSSYTASVLRAALLTTGKKGSDSVVSSFGFLVIPGNGGNEQVLTFSDCAVNIEPDAETLATIAVDTGNSINRLFSIRPRIAIVSFSTKGSNRHPRALLAGKAAALARTQAPHLEIDGELQVDAALDSAVAAFKAGESPVAGRANTLIFPNLEAANIGVKLVQYTAGALSIGAVIQGLNGVINDVSRGATVHELVGMAALSVIQSREDGRK
jgi:phosphate acetyltransferase